MQKAGSWYKTAYKIIVEVIDKWTVDKVPKLGAALSFYTIFSMAPLFLISVVIAGSVFGEEAARGEIVAQLNDLVGSDGAELLQTAVKNAYESSGGTLATIISIVTLMIASTAVFVELQDSLNLVWRVKPKERNVVYDLVRDRLISFAMVVCMGFLLLVSLVMSATISLIQNYMGEAFSLPLDLLDYLNIILSFVIFYILFMMVFKVLPDVSLSWRDVWFGSLITTVLFTIGKYLIGIYIGNSMYVSLYGAAGSLAVLLIWIYYSAMILFLGAEFTFVIARKYGRGIKPRRGAKSVVKQEGTYELHPKE